MSKKYKYLIHDFSSLYKNVTANILLYKSVLIVENKVNEACWIGDLVDGFQDRYDCWELVEAEYMRKLAQKRGRLFRLSALAFLHIAKDLPIVIAQNLNKKYTGEKILEFKALYNSLEQPLEKSLRGNWSKPYEVSFLTKKIFGIDKVFLNWMFNLRNRAWDCGLKILYAKNRQAAIDELSIKIIEAMEKAQKRRRFWVRVLNLNLGFFSLTVISSMLSPIYSLSMRHEFINLPLTLIITVLGCFSSLRFRDKAKSDFFKEFSFEFNPEQAERVSIFITA